MSTKKEYSKNDIEFGNALGEMFCDLFNETAEESGDDERIFFKPKSLDDFSNDDDDTQGGKK